jgi:hypothetical protein
MSDFVDIADLTLPILLLLLANFRFQSQDTGIDSRNPPADLAVTPGRAPLNCDFERGFSHVVCLTFPGNSLHSFALTGKFASITAPVAAAYPHTWNCSLWHYVILLGFLLDIHSALDPVPGKDHLMGPDDDLPCMRIAGATPPLSAADARLATI